MNQHMDNQSVLYRHILLEGSSYEIGKQLGTYLITDSDPIRDFTIESQPSAQATKQHIYQAQEYFDKYCPGINNEIRGFAEGLQVDVEQLLYYYATYQSTGCCSQMIILPNITANGHIYLARNYDYWPQESDLCLITSKGSGKASHIGFSELGIGRTDGINEYGLSISMSNAAPGHTSKISGIDFWAVIRLVLDSCTDVTEAIELIQNLPTSSYTNFLIADRKANAVLIEVAEDKKAVHRLNNHQSKDYLSAANHYQSQQMLKYDNGRYWDSVARIAAMEQRINVASPNVDKQILKAIQSDHYPLGTCCHYYANRFGTLWSAIYDLTEINVEVSFGSPQVNDWHIFDIDSPLVNTRYIGLLPNNDEEPIWKKLSPGAVDENL